MFRSEHGMSSQWLLYKIMDILLYVYFFWYSCTSQTKLTVISWLCFYDVLLDDDSDVVSKASSKKKGSIQHADSNQSLDNSSMSPSDFGQYMMYMSVVCMYTVYMFVICVPMVYMSMVCVSVSLVCMSMVSRSMVCMSMMSRLMVCMSIVSRSMVCMYMMYMCNLWSVCQWSVCLWSVCVYNMCLMCMSLMHMSVPFMSGVYMSITPFMYHVTLITYYCRSPRHSFAHK